MTCFFACFPRRYPELTSMCLDDTKQAFVTQLAIKKVGLVDASPHILHFWCKGAEPQKAAMLFFHVPPQLYGRFPWAFRSAPYKARTP